MNWPETPNQLPVPTDLSQGTSPAINEKSFKIKQLNINNNRLTLSLHTTLVSGSKTAHVKSSSKNSRNSRTSEVVS